MDFVFKLGFNEELSLLELSSITGKQPEKVGEHQYKLSLIGLSQMNYLANRMGGLVEVFNIDGKSIWRHSPKSWIRRDREKPYYDRRKGLLPPKVARILVNLAVGTDEPQGKVLLDPFCGSGTILMEASMINLSLIGGDLDLVQLDGARKNLDWLGFKAELFHADAVKISLQIRGKIDYIVTEPFMGKVTTRPDRLPDLARGLKKLYLGCLKDWNKILSPGGKIVMVFPVFEYRSNNYPTSGVVDDKRLLDYNIKTRGLMYFRPEARVKREIVILQKNLKSEI